MIQLVYRLFIFMKKILTAGIALSLSSAFGVGSSVEASNSPVFDEAKCHVSPAVISTLGDHDFVLEAPEIQVIQKALIANGGSISSANGKFGPQTKRAIFDVQGVLGLYQDCELGGMTAAAISLNQTVAVEKTATVGSGTTASSREVCEARGNYPSVVREFGNFSIEEPTGKNNRIVLEIDKSSHTAVARLTLEGLIDYDLNSSTGECRKDPNESGRKTLVMSSYVAVNQTHTPEGTFSLGGAIDTTCYNDECVLKDFMSLWGEDSRNGKDMDGDIAIHRIPRDVPDGMSVQDAIRNIDNLPPIHSEDALRTKSSSACIRAANKLVNLLKKYRTTVVIQA